MKVGQIDGKTFAARLEHAKKIAAAAAADKAKAEKAALVREMYRTIHGMSVEFNNREKHGTPLGLLIAEAMQHGEASTAPR